MSVLLTAEWSSSIVYELFVGVIVEGRVKLSVSFKSVDEIWLIIVANNADVWSHLFQRSSKYTLIFVEKSDEWI